MRGSYRWILAAALVLTMAPALAMAQTPVAAMACDDLTSYWEEVYYAALPDASLSETAMARAAVGWEPSYRKMSYTELHVAHLYYQQWARDLAETPADDIPDGLEVFHDLSTRYVQAQADAIRAYLDNDVEAYAQVIDDAFAILDDQYEIELAGVEQCGEAWIDAMGEPADPRATATPAA